MLHTRTRSHITFLTAPVLEAIPGVVHAFSTRRPDPDDGFAAVAGMDGWPAVRLRQIHSDRVHWVAGGRLPDAPLEGDAAGTALPGVALGVRTADCVPVLIADRAGTVVAAAHAGWRGTAAGVVRRTVDRMASEWGVAAADLAAAVGPHIGVCCMEVGEDVVDRFDQPEVFVRRSEWPRPHLDLAAANRAQLVAAGVPADRVEVSTLCTRCRPDLFHSYRRDGKGAGRMLSLIGRAP